MECNSRNRLVECSDCHSLYHQECHKPIISEADANNQENSWFCTLCKNKVPETSAVASIPTSPTKQPTVPTKPKNYESSSSSSSSNSSVKATVSTKSSTEQKSEAKKITPNIKIVSNTDKLKALKKSSKSHDSKRRSK